VKKLEDLKGLSFAEGVHGIAFGSDYFYANKGYGNMTSYYSIKEAIKELKGCDYQITDLKTNNKREITYLYGVFEE